MTREDMIRMAKEAGFDYSGTELSWESVICTEELERFAALVISNNPPQPYLTWKEGYEAGKQAEREACAKVCDDWSNWHGDAKIISKAIRARGQA